MCTINTDKHDQNVAQVANHISLKWKVVDSSLKVGNVLGVSPFPMGRARFGVNCILFKKERDHMLLKVIGFTNEL